MVNFAQSIKGSFSTGASYVSSAANAGYKAAFGDKETRGFINGKTVAVATGLGALGYAGAVFHLNAYKFDAGMVDIASNHATFLKGRVMDAATSGAQIASGMVQLISGVFSNCVAFVQNGLSSVDKCVRDDQCFNKLPNLIGGINVGGLPSNLYQAVNNFFYGNQS